MKSCNTCIRKPVCKFVDANDQLADSNKMFSMFEYLESNNLKEIFYENAGSRCKYYVEQDVDFEKMKSKIKTAITQISWLEDDMNYLEKVTDNSKYVEQRKEILKKYKNTLIG